MRKHESIQTGYAYRALNGNIYYGSAFIERGRYSAECFCSEMIADLADAIAVLHILSGIEIQFAVNPGADVDGDEKITMAEGLIILQNISGLR